jgi:dUTP pyrophosphatase
MRRVISYLLSRALAALQLKDTVIDIDVLEEGCEPNYANFGDAGMDCYARETVIIAPNTQQLVPLGFKIRLPYNKELQLRSKSGISFKFKLTLTNSIGTIDSTYRDEVKALVFNLSDHHYTFKKGEKVCQAVVKDYYRVKWNHKKITKDSYRAGGFGSTGLNNNAK